MPMPSEDALIARIHADASRLAQAVADAEFWHGRYLQQIEAEAKSRIAEIERRHRQTLAEAKAAYEAELAKAAAAVRAISDSCGIVAAEWDDPVWRSWAAAAGGALPEALRLGRLRAPGARPLEMPALLFASGRPNAMLTCSGPAKLTATAGVQALAARYVATFPPGKLRFTFIDPVGLGQNAAAFMHLADYDDALVTGKAWTEPQHIEQRLANLTEHMENVIQKYLRNQYGTIEEYNRQAGEIAEPYRVLAVFDFPTNFGEASARRLVSIAQNGPRCGVYTLVVVDSAKPLPYGFSLDELAREATVIAWNGQRFVWLDDDLSACELILDTPPPAPLLNRIIEAVGEAAKQASNVEVPFQRVARPPEEWWTNSSLDGVRAALGPSGARSLQYLDLGQATAQHVLVAGRTGSGKTTLLHTLITNLAVTYGPEEVELYLIDFKEGVAFKTYATHQLPHARVVAIESEREFGLSVLQGLNAELARRGVVFRASAVEALNDHRRSTGEKLPRILLIVDEFQRFFTEDDHIASEARQILDQLVRQGRGFGIHVLLGSQTLAGTYTLLRSTIEQMAVRIALQCSEADSRLILADDNPAARLLSRPGEAIYNAKNGLVEGNSRFQVAWLGDEERDAYLRQVLALAEKRG
ncbi:MAG: cell division protein FtsK, partial [Chloroflexi bacterium]|nr:cell division protein FtsK [Chloroflexota bacterium]